MNQEQVTTENTEEKAAEVTASSEMTGQTQEPVRPKGKWFGRTGSCVCPVISDDAVTSAAFSSVFSVVTCS